MVGVQLIFATSLFFRAETWRVSIGFFVFGFGENQIVQQNDVPSAERNQVEG